MKDERLPADAGEVTSTRHPLVLGGYAAKQCPRATHNAHDLTVPRPTWEPDSATEERMAAGRVFEGRVVEALLAALPGAVDLGYLEGRKHEHVAETMRHLAAGTALVIGGRLPDDPAGGRTGMPDLLIRGEDREDGVPGYHVGDVKHHLTLQRKDGAVAVSVPSAPNRARAVEAPGVRLRWREEDCLQLAHYWRMLETAGHAAGHPWGAVIGTDGESGYVEHSLVLVWHDLALPAFTTFSRSSGSARRSSLERYDHEHAFRVAVAEVARRRTGAADDPEPLVQPIGHEECGDCKWASVCVDVLPAYGLSNQLRADLSVREYLTLRSVGITTVEQLASADPDVLYDDAYAHETAHLRLRAQRLQKAHLHAQLAHAGLTLRRRDAEMAVPVADIEYDVDCEWSTDGHVYLWGVLRSTVDGGTYVPFMDLSIADDESEYGLTVRFLRWLDDQVITDRAAGQSTAIFHYSHAELTRINRVMTALGRSLPELSPQAAPSGWTDLLPLVKGSLDSRRGHGLKVVAVHGAGFAWRDEDPGGLQSQLWFEQASAGDSFAEERLLAYNEDDVRATKAIRTWLLA
ncbi:TM0106 family RecB-like putative nuclease [Modestobacter sp. I12A-02628]|uniref:TM0106 family RecB-like putative nuclease n=1 Tax=Goekera deserti TaxID=2497753 RepID=A0A7K3WLT1_9ACTN|nr:TM0106 family RecB-like putative nuclease [Goekera deserti]MPQ98139.1 TM0106 family RecB-like putative nuclease [Goekera deserti]NDI48787.1 TM0106 family RecB-like putative nuclease [Goekera deserti]NEL56690.1 TM0106 family RecB-like putative nuclease [Goekera deserti]